MKKKKQDHMGFMLVFVFIKFSLLFGPFWRKSEAISVI